MYSWTPPVDNRGVIFIPSHKMDIQMEE